MVTELPTAPDPGVKDVMVGVAEAVTVKLAALVAVPPGVVTAIVPVVAPAGTVTVMEVTLPTVKDVAAVP